MKFLSGLALVVVAVLAACQVLLFRRMVSLESAVVSHAKAQGDDDRRLDALRRTVAALAVSYRGKRAPSKENAAPPAAVKVSTVEEERAADRAEAEDADEAKDDGATDSAPTAPVSAALQRRKQFLAELRSQFGRLDRNGDAKISLKEFEGDISDFVYFDRDSNGTISLDEVASVLAVEERATQRVASGDLDGDGGLSPAEFSGSPRQFRFLDKNADGLITPDELVESHRRVNERFTSEDLDHNKKITPAEFSGGSARFEKFDKNKDGVIDRNELKAMVEHGY